MEYKTILFSVKDGIAWIRFNRPKKLNAMNAQVITEIERVIVECESNDEIKAVIMIGNEKAFIAGADIKPLSDADVNSAFRLVELTTRMQERLADLPKPTIAAISGFALGGGLEVALCCDFRLAAENAVLGLPEITLGIIPGGGGTQRLTRLVGLGPAAEMLLAGVTIKAEKALSIGLVTEVVPVDQLEIKAEDLAMRLAVIPAVAMKACKTAMRSGLNCGLKEGLRIEEMAFCMLFGTLDQKEGMKAFLEKRKPKFLGK
ncbi:enoyl-CoA hydratase/isomerase family protein [Desulfosarcina ovata]|uniref:Crotonase n=1 Tax=Desulfosarcina ovata subsp. ovata TaxID=2752305 RepID=A0A5K8A6J6_9BACT|nr:enoyl-CoA hydratase/isomerase family protein [Desulfosarcina ovata]BBO88091.1 crotonase [Desulfosarcina ovata subsp. ovata]